MCIDTSNAIPCSGKTGEGVDKILEAIINNLPALKEQKKKNLSLWLTVGMTVILEL